MSDAIVTLCGTAALIGFGHTLLGPDHYLPFLAMSRVGRWSLVKTLVITGLCGLGHVLSSVILGLIGIAFGVAVFKLEGIESFRGDLAGWLLLAFGLVYFIWGLRRAIRNRPHTHVHVHADGRAHEHEHVHSKDHMHVHEAADTMCQGSQEGSPMTPWVLFTIFLFGPCEPLIPILMYPAASGSMWGVALVTMIFGVVTIGTMMTIVALTCLGLSSVRLARLQRYSHALAGLVVLACGVAIQVGL